MGSRTWSGSSGRDRPKSPIFRVTWRRLVMVDRVNGSACVPKVGHNCGSQLWVKTVTMRAINARLARPK